MSPRPSSAARVTDEPDDFEWPPTADELSVYDVGPDPCHPVHVPARDAQARRRETPPRAASPRVKGITSRPPVAKVPRLVVVAIAAAVVLAAAIAGWSLSRSVPQPVPVETVHHPAPASAPAPPRLKIVATYPVDPAASTASTTSTAAPGAAPAAAGAGMADAPSIPVAPAAAHHTLAGVPPIDAPDAPGAGVVTPDATLDNRLRPQR